MPAGKGKPAGGYRAGAKGSYGCDGYPTVSADGTVHGCHPTKARAAAQARAIWASTAKKSMTNIEKSMITEGDFVMFLGEDEEIMVGRVEYVMTNPGLLGLPGSEYALEYVEDNKPIIVRKYEQEDGAWEEEPYVCYHRMADVIKIESLSVAVDVIVEMFSTSSAQDVAMDSVDAYDNYVGKSDCCPDGVEKKDPCWEGYVQRGMKPKDGKMVPNCVPVAKAEDLWEDDDSVVYDTDVVNKAEGYSPPQGVRSAARRAIKFKEDGKANGAGTAVGWTRAGQLARGETISLSTVKRMYSYFSRHEVDKKGKDWANQANPSNGYIMWLAWGGDAGFAWSRSIVEREKAKTQKVWDNTPFNLLKGW
jgi:hypothetical protein